MVVIVNALTHATFSFFADCRHVSNANMKSRFLNYLSLGIMTPQWLLCMGQEMVTISLTLWPYFWIRGFDFVFCLYIYSVFISGYSFFYIRIVVLYIQIVPLLYLESHSLYPDSHSFIS